ncbi:exosortase [Marinobacter sp. X15-166B]|uniref:exosortase n=1 Tax=Marinobacter sp. X15-166B TaxID=1897620 RepID=UPI00085BEBCB|nr:exosortase [Marinobacter sp. X15-166B]OEY67742.1 hypothetical protein BG841_15770 [Marinobacter sp. X15-166B]
MNMERFITRTTLRLFVPLGLLAVLMVAVWPTLDGLVQRWLKFDEAYSHGLLILAVCLYLTVSKWRQLRPALGFNAGWVLAFLAAAVLYFTGTVLLIEAFQQVALVPLLLAGLLVIWGWRQTLPFFIPIGLLVFALPFWDYLSWPLQIITVTINQFWLSFLNIEFFVEGVFVYFPGVGAFEIAHGCSGLRYFLVGLTLAVLYGELNLHRLRNRIILALVAVALALFANWIRVFVIIYVGYESNMTSSLIPEHDYFGWWVFAATLVPLFFFARWLENKDRPVSAPPSVHETSSTAAAVGAMVTLTVGTVLAAASWSSYANSSMSVAVKNRPHDIAVVDTAEWLPLFRKHLAGWQPGIRKPDRALAESFALRASIDADGERPPEELFVGLYSYDFQRPGGEVVQYGNRLYDSRELLLQQTIILPTGDGDTLAGLTLKQRGGDENLYLVYGYYVEGRWETNELQAKFAQLHGIFNARSDASVLVVGLRCEDCNGQAALATYAPAIKKSVEIYLDRLYAHPEPLLAH